MTFWDHLDELRGVLLKCILAVLLASVVAFCFKDELFAIVFAPKHSNLFPSLFGSDVNIRLINTELTRQFIIHMMVSVYTGLIVVMPYIIYQLYGFVLPALRKEERRYTTPLILTAYLMFILGVLFCYFIIFPLTFRFLATYQVDTSVENLISLEGYIDTLTFLSLALGIAFELPVLSWFFGRLGILRRRYMQHFRRHAFVIILIVAALITPTTDAFTLALVAIPMYLLYEISILVVKK